jgi:RNA polymerase sigma-70 factor (ECF subfamily)
MSNETNSLDGLSYYDKGAQRTPDPDSALVAQARQGNLDVYEQLVVKHQKRMLNIAYRLLGDYDDACEAVQDAFVSAFKKIGTFRGEARFSTWLTTITLNHARNRLKQTRSRQKIVAFSLDEPVQTREGTMSMDPPSKEPSILERLVTRDVRTKVRECMDALEPEYREVIILRDLQEYSYRDIGAALNVREGTVKSRLFRARDAIKDCLKKAIGEV